MPEDAYFLDERSRKALIDVVAAEVKRRMERPRDAGRVDPTSPETYVARTPPEGIPPVDYGVVTGTGSGTGTTGDDVPGFAQCLIYQLVDQGGTADGFFLRVPQFYKKVFNVTDRYVPGGTWTLVTRDKYGRWHVAGPGGGRAWRMVRASSEDMVNGRFPGFVQEWVGAGTGSSDDSTDDNYEDGEPCWIALAAGNRVINDRGQNRYEGELEGYAADGLPIYGVTGNTVECAPTCDPNDSGVTGVGRWWHRAPFKFQFEAGGQCE